MVTSALDNLSHPPEVVVSFVQNLIDESHHYAGPERRQEPRRSVTLPVIVQLLDDNYRPTTPPVHTLTVNLSGGGIGFIYDTPVKANFTLIHLQSHSGQSMNLIASVRHCTRTGDKYQIGARFILKWSPQARHSV